VSRRRSKLTRGRPYQKDDKAHVEQKNWTPVRKLLGWQGYDSPAAVEAIADLYRHELRLWQNLDLSAVELVKKAKVTFLNGLTRRAILPDPKQRSHGFPRIEIECI